VTGDREVQARLERALTQGERLRLVPVARLGELREDLRALEGSVELNGFQRWIVHELYALTPPALAFPARSIALVAVPHPAYAIVDLEWQGRTHRCMGVLGSDVDQTGEALAAAASAEGLRLAPAPNLPMKRLAVRSGLAVYGRNNVTYVEGMGSHLSFAAWYTDAPGQEEPWREVRVADRCARCEVCLRDCPTGAIREDRFLIDNERCLTFLNERPDPFPAWLPAGIHHTVYDCMRCQLRCPMNKGRGTPPIGPIVFSEEETGLVLAGAPIGELPAPLAAKARRLGFHVWGAGIPRNLKALFAQQQG
jgi:epoxyqueuosine reductase